MGNSALLKRYCIILSLLVFFTYCGGGGSDENNTSLPDISLSESSYDFGGIVLNNQSDKTFVITNNGNAALAVGDISIPSSNSPFSILSDECSGQTLEADGTCSLIARFSPAAQGELTDTLSIPSSDPDGTASIDLSGEGYGLNVWINKIDKASCAITVDVTVTDPGSNDVLDSLEDKFTLYKNGLEISQDITVSQVSTTSPVLVVLDIDWSVSELGIIGTIKTAANSFIDNLNSSDEAAACKFNGDIGFSPETNDTSLFYTGDYSALKTYINSDFISNGGTKLYDAIYDSIDRAIQGSNEKKAVIVLSDGVDVNSTDVPPGSEHTLAETIAHANAYGIPLFTIFYIDLNYKGEDYGNTEVMEKLAVETGGKYYNGTNNLADVYQQISNLLTSEYTITYTSSNCDEAITLDVRADYNGLYGQDSIDITLP